VHARITTLLLGAVLLAALAGCGSGSKTVTEPHTITGPSGASTSTSPPGGPIATAAGVGGHLTPDNIKPSFGSYEFVTPSKNIGCAVQKGFARCDIRHYTWRPPPKPHTCEFDYGGSLNVGGRGRGEIGCVSDTVAGSNQTLPYGSFVQAGSFRCVSRADGVTCESTRSGHGFFIARQTYRVY